MNSAILVVSGSGCVHSFLFPPFEAFAVPLAICGMFSPIVVSTGWSNNVVEEEVTFLKLWPNKSRWNVGATLIRTPPAEAEGFAEVPPQSVGAESDGKSGHHAISARNIEDSNIRHAKTHEPFIYKSPMIPPRVT